MITESLVQKYFNEQDNYLIEEQPEAAEPDLCVVYFSSAGIFYNDEQLENHIQNQYYEYRKNKVVRAGRHIFVRDLWQAFYARGINAKLNSPQKVIEFLRSLTAGYRVICLGNSSGGYMALLAGTVLEAEYVLSFSGIIDIPLMRKAYNGKGSEIQAEHPLPVLTSIICDPRVPIFQFWAAQSFLDIDNMKLSPQIPNMKTFIFDNELHGVPMGLDCLRETINLSPARLHQIADKFNGKIISPLAFRREVLPWSKIVKYYKNQLFYIRLKKGKRLLRLFGREIYSDRPKFVQGLH